eukprot:8457635-Pyramimonas_sp.AAC.1
MRLPHPVHCFVASEGAPPKAPVAQPACVSPTQYRASWPHRKPHRRPQRRSPHASRPPSTALGGPTRCSTD